MATERDPLGNDARKAQRARRLPPDAMCACGENRPETLDLHHPAGHAHAPGLMVVRCRNCHAVDNEAQRDVGADLTHRTDRTLLEVVEAGLRSLAAFFEALAAHFCEWAGWLRTVIDALDGWNPEWRQLRGVVI